MTSTLLASFFSRPICDRTNMSDLCLVALRPRIENFPRANSRTPKICAAAAVDHVVGAAATLGVGATTICYLIPNWIDQQFFFQTRSGSIGD